jgi:hypothetical protein
VSPYFLSAMLVGGVGGGVENRNVILIILGSMRHHFRILKIALLFHTIQNKSVKKYSCYGCIHVFNS